MSTVAPPTHAAAAGHAASAGHAAAAGAPVIPGKPLVADSRVLPLLLNDPRFRPKTVWLCSIWPRALSKTYLHHGYVTYAIPPAPRGSYSLLAVHDTYQLLRNLANPEEEEHVPMGIAAEQLAADLVREFSGGTIGAASGFSIGVMAIAGETPTPAELRRLHETQEGFCRYMVQLADAHWAKREYKEIVEPHRICLDWLESEKREWYKPIVKGREKNCPACGNFINDIATRCMHCSVDLVEFYLSRGTLPPTDDAIVHAEYRRVKAAREELGKSKAQAEKIGDPNLVALLANFQSQIDELKHRNEELERGARERAKHPQGGVTNQGVVKS